MSAFYYANDNMQVFTAAQAQRLVGKVDVLEPGAYLVFAKATYAVSVVHKGDPAPVSPYQVGWFWLTFDGKTDQTSVVVRPSAGDESAHVTLMLAAKTQARADARLEFTRSIRCGALCGASELSP